MAGYARKAGTDGIIENRRLKWYNGMTAKKWQEQGGDRIETEESVCVF